MSSSQRPWALDHEAGPLNNMYINIGANSGSENLWTKKKHHDVRWANYSSMCFKRLCLYFLYKLVRSAVVYNSLFVGLGVWGVRGNERRIFEYGRGWERGLARCLESCAGGKWGVRLGWLPMIRRHLDWITWSLRYSRSMYELSD